MSPAASPHARPGRFLVGSSPPPRSSSSPLPAIGRAAESGGTFNPGSTSFAATIVGQRTASQYFELRNEGPEPIEIRHLGVSGPDSTEFSIESSGCEGVTLSIGGACGLYVAFAPSRRGRREATLEAPDLGGPIEATLEGTGLSQELTVSPSPLAFPTTTKYMSSEEQLTVANQGDVPVAISGTNFEGPGSSAFGTNGSNCSGTLAVGSTCEVTVRFSPQSEGEAARHPPRQRRRPRAAVRRSNSKVSAPRRNCASNRKPSTSA